MEQQLVKQDSLPAVSAENTALISMIERVCLDPQADIAKLEKMLDMQERVLDRNAKQAFTADLAAMQADLPRVMELGTGHNSAKYAKLEDINDTIRPVLQRYGFAVTFRTKQLDKSVTVTAILSHKMGHSDETELTLPLDVSGNKNAVQAVGSTVSYGKRYTLCAMLNISTGDDTDGFLPPPERQAPPERERVPISDSKLAEVINRILSGEVNISRLVNNHSFTESQKTIMKNHFPQVQL